MVADDDAWLGLGLDGSGEPGSLFPPPPSSSFKNAEIVIRESFSTDPPGEVRDKMSAGRVALIFGPDNPMM